MRSISKQFLKNLQEGFLAPITRKVKADVDLDLFIRKNYINIYFKGNSILKLTERKRTGAYKVEIHPKYLQDLVVCDFVDHLTVQNFIAKLPQLKENILHFSKPSLEIEYEQLIFRANNNEKRNNTDYFMIDRQYTLGANYRIDLMGIYWPNPRRRNQIVCPCLMEIKFALNTDIRKVHKQLEAYYELISENPDRIAQDLKSSLVQRIELGLFDQQKPRLEALKTLEISVKLEDYQFILALVDYNPRSTLLELDKILKLHFSNQIKVINSGFGMWGSNFTNLLAN